MTGLAGSQLQFFADEPRVWVAAAIDDTNPLLTPVGDARVWACTHPAPHRICHPEISMVQAQKSHHHNINHLSRRPAFARL
jgi:hypothetical protein